MDVTDMELRHLRYFVAVAKTGSLTRAAAQLGIQQPPLGQQIKALEDEIGVALFERTPKRIALNPAGERFLDSAASILASVEASIEDVRRFARGERGRLRIGFTSSASLHHLTPRVLRAFRQAYPLAEIEVEERETYELVLALQQKRIDAAFLHIAAHEFAGLTSTVLAQEPMVVAIPADHPFARAAKRPISLTMLADQDLVVYRRSDGPGIFAGILKAFEAAGIVPRIVDEAQRLVAAINLVAAGRGLSLVPSTIRILHPQRIVYRPLAATALPPLPLYLAARDGDSLALVRNFIDVTLACASPAKGRKT